LKLLLYSLETVISVNGFYRVRKGRRLGPLEIPKLVSLLQLCCLLILLHVSQGLLHVDHALLHGLEQLSLHHQNLLQDWWGGGLAALLFSTSLFSALVLRLIVLTIMNDR
jgi:hypothetical protein